MDKITDIVDYSTGFFAIMLVIVAYGVRHLLEAIWPTLSTKTPLSVAQRVWEGVALPLAPALFGALLAPLMTTYPFPHIVTATGGSRVVYGLVVGWFSSSFYAAVSFFVKKKWNIDIPGDK